MSFRIEPWIGRGENVNIHLPDVLFVLYCFCFLIVVYGWIFVSWWLYLDGYENVDIHLLQKSFRLLYLYFSCPVLFLDSCIWMDFCFLIVVFGWMWKCKHPSADSAPEMDSWLSPQSTNCRRLPNPACENFLQKAQHFTLFNYRCEKMRFKSNRKILGSEFEKWVLRYHHGLIG